MAKDSFTIVKKESYYESFYVPRVATIVRTEQMTQKEKFFEIELDDGNPLGHLPGQFIVLSLFGYGQAAISVSSSPTKEKRNSFDVCVRKVGSFTTALHNLGPGAKIGVLGPFGIPFPVDELKGNDLLFIAGGLGLIPLRSLINFVLDRRRDYGNVKILLGCKSPEDRLFTGEIHQWEKMSDVGYTCTVDNPTDDWTGNVGVITKLIPYVDIDPRRTYAIIVGPPIMYKFVIRELKNKGLEDRQIIMSLERRMRCGVGRCGHCQMNNFYVCKEGPTFRYDQIKGLEEAL
jgi:sulfhydrogenase subunit gamma (sulfur reductase)